MALSAPTNRGSVALVNRRRECDLLDQFVTDVNEGRSRVVVFRGEAGVGKSALLGYMSGRVGDWQVARAAGVESEMELAFSGLHQLCGSMRGHIGQLPSPQREALEIVFGESSGPPPDRFLVGVATLSLLAEVAESKPLVCLVDDAQWLDEASSQILGFVARRLSAEPLAVVCAARSDVRQDVLPGLPEWVVRGLPDTDARQLLGGTVLGTLDAAVSAQIIAESRGNPLALLELPRTWDVTSVAGGFGLPGSEPVRNKVEQSFVRRLGQLPGETQSLVLLAAAEPLGDRALLHRAAVGLGLDITAVGPAVDAGLLKIGGRVEFMHPLVRSAAYQAADLDDRHRAHRALAEATDEDTDPDRRAWHRARASSGPDEDVALELERSAGRAQARGGVAAAAAFLHRAVALTVDPSRRTDRAISAAQMSLQAGAFSVAHELLSTADAGPLDDFERALVELLRGQCSFASGVGSDAALSLKNAARMLEPFDQGIARETYLTAWVAAVFAGGTRGGEHAQDVCEMVRNLPPPIDTPDALELLLEGLAVLTLEGHAAAVPILRQATVSLATIPLEAILRWGWAATAASDATWDNRGSAEIAHRQSQLIREVGALSHLPVALQAVGNSAVLHGDFADAELVIEEAATIVTSTGARFAPYAALRLAGSRGREAEAVRLIENTVREAANDGQGLAATNAHWAHAVLCNGLGRHQDAQRAAALACAQPCEPFVSAWALPELIEAAVYTGDLEVAERALERLQATTLPSATDYGNGIEMRCRALLRPDSADDLYRDAIDRLNRARVRPELARAHLLYGEWLSSQDRREEARDHLRAAHETFEQIGMEAFGDRTRRELIAAGERVRTRHRSERDLTDKEWKIARLARDGLTNREIGAQLFLSPRTIEWHLRKVFGKLEINARDGLAWALPPDDQDPNSA